MAAFQYQGAGLSDKARLNLQKALALDPSNPELRQALTDMGRP